MQFSNIKCVYKLVFVNTLTYAILRFRYLGFKYDCGLPVPLER